MRRKLRIGFDGRILCGPPRGMARYTNNLLNTLPKIASENEYFLYSDRQLPGDFANSPGIKVRILAPKRFWSNTALAHAAQADDLDVMHFPGNTCWARRVIPTVVTLHDVNPLLDRRFGWRNRLLYVAYLLIMSTAAQAVITDSNASQSSIAKLCPILSRRIAVVHLGVSESFRTVNKACLAVQSTLNQPYLLFVGGCDPNKNLLAVVRSLNYPPLKEQPQFYVVVVGSCSEACYASEVKAAITHFGLTKRIQWLGRVSDEKLAALYRGAVALVFPSFREGFGFPVLEAMACEVPVIASRTTSLPELIGDAGLLVSPEDPGELARAINRVLSDKNLAKSLSLRGKERVRQFTWERAARQTLEVYQRVSGMPLTTGETNDKNI